MASIGVEPIRPYGQWILNPSRLPIPPRGRNLIRVLLSRNTRLFQGFRPASLWRLDSPQAPSKSNGDPAEQGLREIGLTSSRAPSVPVAVSGSEHARVTPRGQRRINGVRQVSGLRRGRGI